MAMTRAVFHKRKIARAKMCQEQAAPKCKIRSATDGRRSRSPLCWAFMLEKFEHHGTIEGL